MKLLVSAITIAAWTLLVLAPAASTTPGPGGCDARFQSGDPLLKFCQGLNAGIGGAEIQIKSLSMMVEKSGGGCDVYRLSRQGGGTSWLQPSSSATNEKCTSAFATFSQPPSDQPPLQVPFYLSGDRYQEFFEKLAWKLEQTRNPKSLGLPDVADLMIVADFRSGPTDALPMPIAIATSYHTTLQGRIFKKLRAGYLCPSPVNPVAGQQCRVSSEPASSVGPFHADPNGWHAYKILSGYGSDRLVEVTYRFDSGGGTPIDFSIPEYCRPTSYYVQSARAHFNLEGHPHPPHGNSVTVDFCACSSYDSNGLCIVN